MLKTKSPFYTEFYITNTMIFIGKILMGSFLIAFCAQVSIPLTPVPMTMQSFAVIVLGLIANPKIACGSVLVYLSEACMGLPVLEGFSTGAAAILTTGYLVGFLMMTYFISLFKSRAQSTAHLFYLCLISQILLYTPGITWLAFCIGFKDAFIFGFYPFILKIPFDILFALFTVHFVNQIKNCIPRN